jgi:hypothetical protein
VTQGVHVSTVVIALVVGEPISDAKPPVQPVSLAEADAIAALAQRAGVAALRLADDAPGVRTIDPSLVGAFLAGRYSGLGYLVDAPTTHNAPYNLARRVLSFDRATAGRSGLVLRAGQGDEVSEATAPDRVADDPARRWAEYARIVTGLWESFPRDALLGDQQRALVVDDTLIRPIAHEGRFYRVAGPMDGPSSVQGRPVLVAADLDVLGWPVAARFADAVVVSREQADSADRALRTAVERAGRERAEVALIGRAAGGFAELDDWAADAGLDAVELAPSGGAEQIEELLRDLAPADPGATLRATFGLPGLAGVLA